MTITARPKLYRGCLDSITPVSREYADQGTHALNGTVERIILQLTP